LSFKHPKIPKVKMQCVGVDQQKNEDQDLEGSFKTLLYVLEGLYVSNVKEAAMLEVAHFSKLLDQFNNRTVEQRSFKHGCLVLSRHSTSF
jgi:hypothetical protein